jgi:hypothetical protein
MHFVEERVGHEGSQPLQPPPSCLAKVVVRGGGVHRDPPNIEDGLQMTPHDHLCGLGFPTSHLCLE